MGIVIGIVCFILIGSIFCIMVSFFIKEDDINDTEYVDDVVKRYNMELDRLNSSIKEQKKEIRELEKLLDSKFDTSKVIDYNK